MGSKKKNDKNQGWVPGQRQQKGKKKKILAFPKKTEQRAPLFEGPMTKKTKLILIVIAAVLAAAIVAGAVVLIVTNLPKPTTYTPQAYDYLPLVSSLDKYLSLTSGDYNGKTVSMKDYYEKFVAENDITYATVDDAFVDEEIAYLLLQARKAVNGTVASVTGKIGYGDDVSLFILSATAVNDKGETVNVDPERKIFLNAYSAVMTMTVGAYQFGEAFDNALIGLSPVNTKYSENTDVVISTIVDSDVVRLAYTATVDGEKTAHTTVNGNRHLASDELARLFIENGGDLLTGENITFDRTEDIDGDGDEELVHYKGTVVSVMREKSATLTVALPEDYFKGKDYEDYKWLNGKEVTFDYIITSFVDYNAYRPEELTVSILKNDLGYKGVFPAGATDEEKLAQYRKELKDQYLETQTESKLTYEKSAIWKFLTDNAKITVYPDEAYHFYYDYLLEDVKGAFDYYKNTYSDFPYETVDEFAADSYYGYDAEEYKTVEDYLDYMAKTEVAYNLILQAILKAEGLTPSAADYDKARTEWLEEQRQAALESGQKVSIDEIIKSIGEDNVRLLSRQQLESEIVEKLLLEKFTKDYTGLELGC